VQSPACYLPMRDSPFRQVQLPDETHRVLDPANPCPWKEEPSLIVGKIICQAESNFRFYFGTWRRFSEPSHHGSSDGHQ
jgi:hypothetical protein